MRFWGVIFLPFDGKILCTINIIIDLAGGLIGYVKKTASSAVTCELVC